MTFSPSESSSADHATDDVYVRPRVRQAVLALLYRDGWTDLPEPLLTHTFQELNLTPLDLHLVQFELQMMFGINITGNAGVALTDSLSQLLLAVEQRLATSPEGNPQNSLKLSCQPFLSRACCELPE